MHDTLIHPLQVYQGFMTFYLYLRHHLLSLKNTIFHITLINGSLSHFNHHIHILSHTHPS
nr:MAG TPA: hypothetical protein [Caudoviricetes sp.]